MTLFVIVYDVDYEEDLFEVLEAAGVEAYTQWDRVLGRGRTSDPKLDTPVWPGFNRVVAAALAEEAGERLAEALAGLCSRLGGSGLKVLELPLLRVL